MVGSIHIYHFKCLNWNENKIINKSEQFFGNKCNHDMWYNNLNNKCKDIVKEKINVLRNNIESSEYRVIMKQRIINRKNKKTINNNISNDKTKLAVLNRFKQSKYNQNKYNPKSNISSIKKRKKRIIKKYRKIR